MIGETDDAFAMAERFLSACGAGQEPPLDLVDKMCAQAMDGRRSGAAMAALYGLIVEGLCDDFSTAATDQCALVLLRMLDWLRRLETGRQFGQWLAAQGYADSEALMARYRQMLAPCRAFPVVDTPGQPGKVVVLSRVTIGADVTITGVLVQRLRRRFPAAEIVLIGPRHLGQIFQNFTGARWRDFAYPRYGSLVDRVVSCRQVADIIKEEAASVPFDTILVDPDTRLSQLGLLPLHPLAASFYFPSRAGSHETELSSLVELANGWCDTVFGPDEFVWPAVFFDPAIRQAARRFVDVQRQDGAWVVALNLGVGQNDGKRVAEPFEELLLLRLLAWRPTVVILDSGSSPMGRERAERLLAVARRHGHETSFVGEDKMAGAGRIVRHGVIGFHGGVAAIGSVIAAADCFFGYDSCCQHLANAAETPATIAFAGAPHDRFINRWHPHNRVDSALVVRVNKNEQCGDVATISALAEKIAGSLRTQSFPG